MLTDTFGWRSIFFINLPIGIALFAGGVARLRESRNPAGGRADWVGTALVTGALTALMFALIRGNAMGWGSPVIVALFAAAAVAFAGFVVYELRVAAAPMADLRLFRRRSFAATGFVAFAISATVIGMISYLSLYVQNTLGYSPVQAGLRLLPLSPASFAVALVTGRLIGRVAMRVLLGAAMVAAAAGLASMARLTATSTWLVLLPGLILAGIGLGITSTGLASASSVTGTAWGRSASSRRWSSPTAACISCARRCWITSTGCRHPSATRSPWSSGWTRGHHPTGSWLPSPP